MVLGRQTIANVVEEGTDNPIDVGTFTLGPGCRLQPMLQTGDLIPLQSFLALPCHFLQQPVSGTAQKACLLLVQQLVIFAGAVFHLGEGNSVHGSSPLPVRS